MSGYSEATPGGSVPAPLSSSAPARRRRKKIAPQEDEQNYSPLLVLKIGTSSLIVSDESGQRLQLANVAQLVEVISTLKRQNYKVVLVSSGAVGMGCIKLGLKEKPSNLRVKQAVAAAGQSQLMRTYENLFATVSVQVAQLLLSQSDFLEKEHWANVRNTIKECLNLGLVPIINENDSTNTQEIRFGDNDNLAALTAAQLNADALVLFTDVDYLYTANPRTDPSARRLRLVREPWSLQVDTRSEGSGLGTGGMATKIVAARTVSSAGIPCCLINGQDPRRLFAFLGFDFESCSDEAAAGMPEGTFFMAMEASNTITDTRRWILSLPVAGELTVDDGAASAIAHRKSLLPAGIITVSGRFLRNEAVRLMHLGSEVARAVTNYDVEEMSKLAGLRSSEFEDALGYACCAEACHRGNIILTASAEVLRSLNAPSKDGAAPRRTSPVRGD